MKFINLLPIIVGVTLRLIQINVPIVGVHSWRQADTAAMARNFALNNTPIWLPQVDWGGAGKGYVESEFPLFPYILGQIYKITGVHDWLGRCLSVFFSAITIYLIIRIGKRLIDSESGWWGGLFFAILPLGVYYGRTLQAEAFLLMLAAISLDQMITWREEKNRFSLLISWMMFTLACLIKVLPLIWLGLPLLIASLETNSLKYKDKNINYILNRIIKRFNNPWPMIYVFSTILIGFCWYLHAYKLGQDSGISFGFWGAGSDRSSLTKILNFELWLNLSLRIFIRIFGVIGLPLMVIGFLAIMKRRNCEIFASGIIGVFITTLLAVNASSIHEYYQLPLEIFTCPLIGKGWLETKKQFKSKNIDLNWMGLNIFLIMMISFSVLHFDYWLVERKQAKIWVPLAKRISTLVPVNEKIISATGSDPTLLNLSRRQGWLTNSSGINPEQLKDWLDQGATYIAGSLEWEEAYFSIEGEASKMELKNLLCKSQPFNSCIETSNQTYIFKISKLIE